MKKFKHFDAEVMVQTLESGAFLKAAKKDGINLVELPILNHRVFTYSVDGIKKYAVLVPGAEFETVYTLQLRFQRI